MKRSLTIEVAGQKLTLRTDAEEAYVRELADLVNRQIDEVRKGTRAVSTHAAALLAAMTLADELLQARRKTADLRERVRAKSRRILAMLDGERVPPDAPAGPDVASGRSPVVPDGAPEDVLVDGGPDPDPDPDPVPRPGEA